MEDEKILIYKDTVLRKSDLGILKGPCYLNDEIIGFYFRYLSSKFDSDEILFVPPSVSFWLTNMESSESKKENIEPMKLDEKKIVIFPINNCYDCEGGDDGTHWSTLIYYSSTKMFVHHDSMRGVNNECATRLYEVVKGFVSSPNLSKPSSKGRKKNMKKKDLKPSNNGSAVPTIPGFTEYEMTPQQSNGYDCGLYVLAIAKTICQWHAGGSRGKDANWFSVMKKHVNESSVEMNMRSEVLNAVEELMKANKCLMDSSVLLEKLSVC